jgi:pantothenate kinase
MNMVDIKEKNDRVNVEIEALERWYDDLKRYLESGMKDTSVSPEEFSNAATMSTRVLMRLKALYDRTTRC